MNSIIKIACPLIFAVLGKCKKEKVQTSTQINLTRDTFPPSTFPPPPPPPGYLFTDLKWERSAYGDYLILVIPHTEDMLDSLGYLRLVSVHIFNETLPN